MAMKEGLIYSLVNSRDKGVCLVRFELRTKSFDTIADNMTGTFKTKQLQKIKP